MNKKLLPLLALSAAALLGLAGCATQSPYVDPTSSRTITEVGRINIQDFANAAGTMMESLIKNIVSEDKLKSAAAGEPALLAISRIQNNTGQQLDTDQLVKKMRVELLRTGKVQTSTTMNLGGAEDPLAKEQQATQEFLEDKKHTRLPDYTLSGKIIQDQARAGNVRQSSFIFQLSLSSRAGIAIWEDEKIITKQGNRPNVGF